MSDDLERMIEIASISLSMEDKFLLGTSFWSKGAYRGKKCGLLRTGINERHYQYILARGFMGTLTYDVFMERENRTDLLLKHPGSDKIYAAIEIKTLFKEGSQNYQGIQADIEKKLLPSDAENALMMVLSATAPVGDASKARSDLSAYISRRLDVRERWYNRAFLTIDERQQPCEFWIAMILMRP